MNSYSNETPSINVMRHLTFMIESEVSILMNLLSISHSILIDMSSIRELKEKTTKYSSLQF